eukprot:CAMPEP_0171069578 /NCGR_PEP_ID=MMETSP0766_2-20121228/9229_1 /TAXON_ID=439317 /ORGANISM="Gambierdiscus australes, Strain CAWD 149" /LENGTH=468 /DNA_ID=CAMNT_0011525969 /DNA_START=83 /DNA_END=1489 /DNA_ORIENTATION=-
MKLMGKLNCGGKRCNCRRCRCCARRLLDVGWDEFEGFEAIVTVHGVGDIQKGGLMGGKEFKLRISFSYSRWETTSTKDCRWEQTKTIEVPQGAVDCQIQLFSLGKLRDTKVAECVMDTKKDLVDKGDEFWGQKQKLKLESKGKFVGSLAITFRRKEAGEGPAAQGGSSSAALPISGVLADSALALEVLKEMEEIASTPGFIKPEGKWEGDMKVGLLARVLSGDLREVNKKNGKEMGKLFVRVLQCTSAELAGDEMKEQLQKQMERAKKKGLKQPERKWYWAWYEDRKSAHDSKKWHYPDGFIPMISILKVNRSPDRNDQFLITYGEDGSKDTLIYRRDVGKGLDVWVEALDICFTECRRLVKEKKDKGEKADQALVRMRQMHAQWVQRSGLPQSDEQWTRWFEWFKSNNYSEDLIKRLFQEIAAQQQQAASRQQQRQPAVAPAAAAQHQQQQQQLQQQQQQAKARHML